MLQDLPLSLLPKVSCFSSPAALRTSTLVSIMGLLPSPQAWYHLGDGWSFSSGRTEAEWSVNTRSRNCVVSPGLNVVGRMTYRPFENLLGKR